MSLIRSKGTGPEAAVRAVIAKLGCSFKVHEARLPGSPDFVFARRWKVIFVHGCFWHRHKSARCALARLPKSRLHFWLPKLEANSKRDARFQRALNRGGWRYLIIWECQLLHPERVEARIARFLTKPRGKR
jgi:DNA mismatch endonuclease (patch repair protein)